MNQESLDESFDSLARTVLNVKRERDLLLEAAKELVGYATWARMQSDQKLANGFTLLEKAIAQAEGKP